MKRTQAEKKEYFQNLRDNWNRAKKMLDEKQCSEIDAIIQTHGMNISRVGFVIVRSQMKAQGLDGLPYLDAKTFQGWKENGFRVKKGEHSTLDGITWIGVEKKVEGSDEKDSFVMPKGYRLFHRSQVEAA